MKYIIVFFVFFSFLLAFNGCDTGSNSKAISTEPPALVSPYDNDSNVTILTTFMWDGDADILWVDTNPSFENHVEYTINGGSIYTVSAPLSTNSSFYWKAVKIIGGQTYWSENYYYLRTGTN